MGFSVELWLEYIIRFAHVITGIVWIGESFYFIWLDKAFEPPKVERKNVDGEVYMVHGGFYYQVDKRRIYPGEIPEKLHWFKWEATATFATGFLLLMVVYWTRGAALLIDPTVLELSQLSAILLSTAFLAGSWFVYDFIWHPRFVDKQFFSTIISLIFFPLLAFAATSIFSARGAFIIVGATLGAMMFLNVWVRILPGQRKMLAEAEAGEVPDYSASTKSKARSVHNTYFIFPVLFLMLSNHYPAVYNHELNWLMIILIGIAGASLRYAMVAKKLSPLILTVLGFAGLLSLTARDPLPAPNATSDKPVTYAEVAVVVQKRCLSCHARENTDDVFTVAPNGIYFESEAELMASKDKIIQHVVVSKYMPLANKTGMLDSEREIMHRWLTQEDGG